LNLASRGAEAGAAGCEVEGTMQKGWLYAGTNKQGLIVSVTTARSATAGEESSREAKGEVARYGTADARGLWKEGDSHELAFATLMLVCEAKATELNERQGGAG
jgi:hypothetical protein